MSQENVELARAGYERSIGRDLDAAVAVITRPADEIGYANAEAQRELDARRQRSFREAEGKFIQAAERLFK